MAIFWESSKNIIEKQYLYTNISHLIQEKANVWDLIIGDIVNSLNNDVLNIDTCTDSALDNYWGRIFKLTRTFENKDLPVFALGTYGEVDPEKGVATFGLYNGANFGSVATYQESEQFFTLTTEEFRRLLKIRAFSRRYNAGTKELNQLFYEVFGEDINAFVVDNQDMTISFFFDGVISDGERYIYENNDLIPRPAGVGPLISTILQGKYFALGEYDAPDPTFSVASFGTFAGTEDGKTATYFIDNTTTTRRI